MKSQFYTLFGLVCLATIAFAVDDNSTSTVPLAEDVKPAISETQAANQKVDNQELDRADVKDKANAAIDTVADKLNDANEKGASAINSAKDSAKQAGSDAADSVKSAADSTKDAADSAKDKIQNSATSNLGFTAVVSSLAMVFFARL